MLSKETFCEALRFHSFIRHMECRLLSKNIKLSTSLHPHEPQVASGQTARQ